MIWFHHKFARGVYQAKLFIRFVRSVKSNDVKRTTRVRSFIAVQLKLKFVNSIKRYTFSPIYPFIVNENPLLSEAFLLFPLLYVQNSSLTANSPKSLKVALIPSKVALMQLD